MGSYMDYLVRFFALLWHQRAPQGITKWLWERVAKSRGPQYTYKNTCDDPEQGPGARLGYL